MIFLAMLLAALFLGVIGLTFANVFARIINIPRSVLLPSIVLLCVVGTFAMRNALFDVGVLLAAGLLGYTLRRVKVPLPPLLLGFILGPMLEDNFRRALLLSDGNWSTFILRPISGVILLLAVALTVYGILRGRKKGSVSN